METSEQTAPVAEGDTFERASDTGGPWEATRPGVCAPWWHLQRGDEVAMVREGDLLDPKRYRRARCL